MIESKLSQYGIFVEAVQENLMCLNCGCTMMEHIQGSRYRCKACKQISRKWVK